MRDFCRHKRVGTAGERRRRGAAMTEPVRLGLVGAGGIAAGYADLLASSTTATCVGVADVRAEAAAALAERLDCPTFTDAADLSAVEGLEAVVICTPPATHPDLALHFAGRGVHILSEKPLAIDRHAAAAMVTAADDAGVLLTMATKFRFCADVNRASLLIAQGRIGDVRLVENAFTSRLDMRSRWNADPAVSGGGVIADNGPHSVDLIRHLLGPISEVLAVEACRSADLAVEDTARLHLRTDAGVDAHVDLSWSIDKSLPDFLRVYGTLGEVRVGWRESAWRPYGGDWENIGFGYAKAPAMGGALDTFCRAVRGISALIATLDDAIAAVTCIDAAYESLRRGGWVKLAELEE
jgi:predicted dehydrogenase